MKKFLNVLVKSSANPENVSLTLKGILMQYAVLILSALVFLGFNIDQTKVTELITKTAFIFGIVLSLVGLTRKLYYQLQEFTKDMQ